uniref:P-type Cu(+) transporter n=1 Tax=Parascaris equorum TaxID=6256 RepID=A0A914SIL9_PAREQ
LTGESEPQSRSPECTNENPLETKNIAFFSTNAVEGTCRGIVIYTGDRTVMGRIAHLASGLDTGKTPIAREIEHFIHLITGVAVFLGVTFFIIAFILGYHWLTAVVFLIGIYALLLKTLKKTPTNQELHFREKERGDDAFQLSQFVTPQTGSGILQYDLNVEECDTSENQSSALRQSTQGGETCNALTRICALCNRAEFKAGQEDIPILRRECTGDASEIALLKYSLIHLALTKPIQIDSKMPQVSIHETNDGDPSYLLVMKGAPERILDRCKTILDLRQTNRSQALCRCPRKTAFITLLTSLRLYVMLARFAFDTEDVNFPVEGLRFVGLVSMIDPPRAAVPDAVSKCRSAGIKVVMVTGDHPITAKAIAKSVGIISEGTETVEDIAIRKNCTIEEVCQ